MVFFMVVEGGGGGGGTPENGFAPLPCALANFHLNFF